MNKRSGFGVVTDITHAGDGSKRIFVASKGGTITILDSAFTTVGLLLNISSLISTSSEKGLLGLTFHPGFATNGFFFVNYNPTGTNNTVIARFTATNPAANTTVLNTSQKTILTITSALYGNHKGGDLVFGSDGYLYITTGDGGDGGDPHGNGQNGNTFLGKLLRLNIDTDLQPYLIPAGNPFVSNPNVLDEIWDLGLRNPWRISFDRQTHDLWIADVGQGAREEINFEATGSPGGYNYGWKCREGFIGYSPGCQNDTGFTNPIYDYQRCSPCSTAVGFGNSVTGGFVYRGTKPSNAALIGYYVFADYVSTHAWMIKYTSGSVSDVKTISSLTTSGVTSFGELENGELMAGLGNGNIGTIEATVLLPIRLTSFKANWNKSYVQLHWSSTSEINLQSYRIEKSINGIDFSVIGEVKALTQSNVPSEYFFKDDRAFPGKIYYRLKTMDHDGLFDYSPVCHITVIASTDTKAYFKYTTKEIIISGNVPGTKEKISLYSMGGKQMQQWVNDGKPLRADQLAAGVYILALEQHGVATIQKIIVY